MNHTLSSTDLVALILRIFTPTAADRRLAIIVDMPDEHTPDHPAWRARRETAASWAAALIPQAAACRLEEISFICYPNARANNADLPAEGFICDPGALPENGMAIRGKKVSFESVFKEYTILIAPTEFSATAPLKVAAKKFGFRAATMPGFAPSMIPALRLDYNVVGRKVNLLKGMLDEATGCKIEFDVEGTTHTLNLDLRHRTAHASGGVFPDPGVAGNLPSGEAYIVPYEGELEGDPSRTNGEIPVQFAEEVVVYEIVENKAVHVLTTNDASAREAAHLAAEPAYGNLAELGLGVLGEFGLEPTGKILLDEKLGLHIAFGRSEHFGGQVGPGAFSAPDKVVHIDRVYIPKLQPRVVIASATLIYDGKSPVLLMKDGAYQVEV